MINALKKLPVPELVLTVDWGQCTENSTIVLTAKERQKINILQEHMMLCVRDDKGRIVRIGCDSNNDLFLQDGLNTEGKLIHMQLADSSTRKTHQAVAKFKHILSKVPFTPNVILMLEDSLNDSSPLLICVNLSPEQLANITLLRLGQSVVVTEGNLRIEIGKVTNDPSNFYFYVSDGKFLDHDFNLVGVLTL